MQMLTAEEALLTLSKIFNWEEFLKKASEVKELADFSILRCQNSQDWSTEGSHCVIDY